MIFRKGLTYKLQDKLIGLKSKDLDELQNWTIKIADQLYRIELHSKESSHGQKNHESRNRGKLRRQRSPSPVLQDTMDGVEYTGRSRKPLRPSNSEYDQLRREGRCFNCKRRGHVLAQCTKDEGLRKKEKDKSTAVLKVSSSKTKGQKKSQKD